MRLDIARRRERQQDWECCYHTRKRRTCEATLIGLVDEPTEPYTGARRIETYVSHKACRCVTRCYSNRLIICSVCCTRPVSYFDFIFSVRVAFLLSFPCSADHKRNYWTTLVSRVSSVYTHDGGHSDTKMEFVNMYSRHACSTDLQHNTTSPV